MASSHVKAIFTVLLSAGILSALSTPTGEAAADDDEIALEDYVDSELPNFSGDVSSSVFGDAAGYDVHIEVKIANRSKSKDDKNENLRHVSELLSPSSLGSSQNHEKAKKILDLIIEKLKRKKDAKGTIDDDTDIEISEKDDFMGETKARHRKPDSGGINNLPNDDLDATLTPNDGFVDPSKEKLSTNGKHPELSSSSKFKSEKHAFNLPEAGKTDTKADDFSFKAANSGHKQVQTNPITELTNFTPLTINESPEPSSEQWESSKSNKKMGESSRRNKDVKIKISEDGEIRIKVPEFLNKSSLVSKIVNIVNEDDKQAESDTAIRAKQALVNMESKLAKQNAYKLLLLKKIHISGEMAPDQHLSSDTPVDVNDTHLKETATVVNENIENKADLPISKASPTNESDKLREAMKKKEKAADNQENLPAKKISTVSKTTSEEGNELGSANQSVQSELMAEKEEVDEKVKPHENKAMTSDHEFTEMPKNDAFVPNRVASKSFQENLEPEDVGDRIFENSNSNPTEKKALEILPIDLHIEDVNTQEKMNTMMPKKVDSKLTSRQHKLESVNNNSPNTDTQKYVQMQIVQMSMPNENKHDVVDDHVPVLNPGRLFNDSLFQQAGLDNSEGIDSKHKIEKQQSPTISFNGDSKHDFKLTTGKKDDMRSSNHPFIDILTFPTFSEMSATMLENKRKMSHSGVENKLNKLRNTNAHITTDHRHENSHNAITYGHKKSANMAESNHGKPHNSLNNKDGKREPLPKEKIKTLSNPPPSVFFKDMLNNVNAVSRPPKRNKNNKKADNDAPDEHEVIAKKHEQRMEKEGEEEIDNDSSISHKNMKSNSASMQMKSNTKGGKLDFSDLASLQLQSKDNLEIGSDGQDDDGEGEDDEYEDASGDEEEEVGAISNNPDEASLNNANLAIWKASEDIHALLHSLTDREHADRVLGNLKNFIRDKHSGVTRKRNLLGHKINLKKEKRNFPYLNKKNIQKGKNKFPENLEVKRRSWIAEKRRTRKHSNSSRKRIGKRKTVCKRHSIILCKPYLKAQAGKRQNIIHYEKYTNHNGNGIDRLYNQLATSMSRIAPTFEDDPEGWSADEVKNVMKQLRTTDTEDISATPGNKNSAIADYDDVGAPYSDYMRHVGLPQSNVPVSGENVHAKHVIPMLQQFKKNVNNQQKSIFPVKYKEAGQVNYINGVRDGNSAAVQVKGEPPSYLFNSTVQFNNGDYIGGDSRNDIYNNYMLWRHNDAANSMQSGL